VTSLSHVILGIHTTIYNEKKARAPQGLSSQWWWWSIMNNKLFFL